MSSMALSTKQATVLVEFINEELSEYVEKKVKQIDLTKEGEAFKCYEETRTALMEIREYAEEVIEYARNNSGTWSAPDAVSIPYTKHKSEITDPWNQST